MEEISRAIKKAKSQSAPSPFDRIQYTVYKKCPSLMLALHSLFNMCWESSSMPQLWKTAAIKLIPKGTAVEDPTQPSNFRPISLTPSTGKLFTTILRDRWLSFMIQNKFLDQSIQKAFMPSTPGCIENHLKLMSVLSEARRNHKTVAVCWLDLKNAYGSVHHSLIEYSLKHYHAPPKFYNMVNGV